MQQPPEIDGIRKFPDLLAEYIGAWRSADAGCNNCGRDALVRTFSRKVADRHRLIAPGRK